MQLPFLFLAGLLLTFEFRIATCLFCGAFITVLLPQFAFTFPGLLCQFERADFALQLPLGLLEFLLPGAQCRAFRLQRVAV